MTILVTGGAGYLPLVLDNLKIQTNVIEAAWRSGYGACCFWAAAASTPSCPDQPIREKAMLTGPLEPTNSQVVPALIRRFYEAAETQARAWAKAKPAKP